MCFGPWEHVTEVRRTSGSSKRLATFLEGFPLGLYHILWRLYHILWKDWCWSWNSNTLTTWCEELTHWRWCWERLKAGGEGDNRGWDGWMASPTWWTWVWVNSRSWWWTGRAGVLWFMGLQTVGHDWATELWRLGILSALSPVHHVPKCWLWDWLNLCPLPGHPVPPVGMPIDCD